MATVACGPSMMVVRRRSWIGLVVELGYGLPGGWERERAEGVRKQGLMLYSFVFPLSVWNNIQI